MSGYSQNFRSSLRKISGYERQAAQILTVVQNGVSNSYDQNSHRVIREFYFVQLANPGVHRLERGTYDEDYITFTGGSTAYKAFNVTFTSIPALALEIEPLDLNKNKENLIPVILSLSKIGFSASLTSDFSGSIKYRAVYSRTYPATVFRGVLYPTASYREITVVSVSLSGTTTSFTASFPSIGTQPSSIYYSILDSFSYNDCSVAVDSGSCIAGAVGLNIDTMPVELSSAPAGATITFIGVT